MQHKLANQIFGQWVNHPQVFKLAFINFDEQLLLRGGPKGTVPI